MLRVTRSTPGKAKRVFASVFATASLLLLFFAGSYLLPSLHSDWKHMQGPSLSNSDIRQAIIDGVSNASIEAYTDHYYLSGPHLMGENEALAEWTRSKYEEFGFDAKIVSYEVLRNLPAGHSVKVFNHSKELFSLKLEEDVLEEDLTTGSPDRIPTFHGYSASGNATGKLVYANYGRKQDFDLLVELGIDLKDKIVLTRYGHIARGLKVRGAEELGASAVLIFSDPYDDGEIREVNGYAAYPNGPARNPSSVQRGSVQDLAAVAGDPTTVGTPSLPGVNRSEPIGIPGIPSIPISAKEGQKLLKLLNKLGKKVDGWQGDLKADYSIGPSLVDVEVWSDQNYDFAPIYDVIATLPGQTGEQVVVGNHRDAWILGGADPNSGSATVLELARVLGELYSTGWRPFRTLVFGSWDGEEYGLVGSTEWGEDEAKHLSNHVAAYLNVDVAYSGLGFHVSANPLLHNAIYSSAKRTPHPLHEDLSLYDYWAAGESKAQIYPMGSGSDFVVFQDHLGIPSMDVGFEGGKYSPVYHYHSNYDSLHWMKTFGDPSFRYHATVGKFLGLVITELTGYSVLPFRASSYAHLLQSTLKTYLEDIDSEDASTLLEDAENFVDASTSFDSYLDELDEEYHKDFKWWEKWKRALVSAKIRIANLKSIYLDRKFLYPEGLDNRNWFKHVVFAPGRYTGYAGQVLPGIAESLEDRDVVQLKKWIGITHDAVSRAIDAIS